MNATTYQETIRRKGVPIRVNAVRAGNKAFIISGRFIKTAALKNEWQEDLDDPDNVIRELKASPAGIDLLRFWQRIPDSEAKFDYYREQRDIAAILIKDYETWWLKQISSKTRNMVRKSQKAGVTIDQVELSDHLIGGIMDIFNESPIRRGKPFWHYRKDFDTVKKEMSLDLQNSIFIAAYYEEDLIGYAKLLVTDRYAMITMILDKMLHRNKSPMNGMIAKAVEICAARRIPYLTYTVWRRGDHGEFQKRNGFQQISVPEYFVPLTLKGEIALRLGLHKGLKGAIPEKMMVWLLSLRSKWYSMRHAQKAA
jgi:hypothetical protein